MPKPCWECQTALGCLTFCKSWMLLLSFFYYCSTVMVTIDQRFALEIVAKPACIHPSPKISLVSDIRFVLMICFYLLNHLAFQSISKVFTRKTNMDLLTKYTFSSLIRCANHKLAQWPTMTHKIHSEHRYRIWERFPVRVSVDHVQLINLILKDSTFTKLCTVGSNFVDTITPVQSDSLQSQGYWSYTTRGKQKLSGHLPLIH